MKKTIKALIIIFVLVNIYSFIPIVSFYLKDAPIGVKKNENLTELLKDNKDPYFSFIVTSDTGTGLFLNEASTLKIISSINSEDRFKKVPIDFVANVGDVTFRGRESHYKNYVKIKDMIKFPTLDVIGNHDDDIDNGPRGEELFANYCGKKEFSFIDRNSYFIVLDNKDGDFKESQFNWLKSELDKAQSYKHIFIFMHKPPFNPFHESWYRVETNPWSHRFMKLCDENNVDMVFSGHESGVRVARFGKVTYVVSCGGGTLLMQPTSLGGYLNYVLVKVNGDYIDYEIRKVFPPVWEYFFYYAWKDFSYFLRGLLN